MKIKFDQHTYTSLDPEFATLDKTVGISNDELMDLEKYSLYFLPPELSYDGDFEYPVKYVFYRTGKRYVTGKAVYTGKDTLGRPGNYFFHNLVINHDDYSYFSYNPLTIINFLEKNKIFTVNKSAKLGQLNIDVNHPAKPAYYDRLKNDELAVIVESLRTFKENGKSVVFKGKPDELRALLFTIYSLLPHDIRRDTFFDTYSYGTGNFFPLICLPSSDMFKQYTGFSVEYDLLTSSFSSDKLTISENTSSTLKYLEKNNFIKLENIYTLYDLFLFDKTEFIRSISEQEDKVIDDFYSLYKKQLINVIVSGKDTALFYLFAGFIGHDDLQIILTKDGLVPELLEIENEKRIIVIDWLFSQTDVEKYYSPIFDSGSTFKEMIRRLVNDLDGSGSTWNTGKISLILSGLFLYLTKRYDGEKENQLLELLLKNAASNKDYSEDNKMISCLKKMKKPFSPKAGFLRSFFIHLQDHKIDEWIYTWDFSLLENKERAFVIKKITEMIVNINKEEKIKKMAGIVSGILSDKGEFLQILSGRIKKTGSFEGLITYLNDHQKG